MYSKTLCVLLLVFSATTFSNGQRNKKFFRKDYKYIEAAESFYKFHIISRTWQDAKRICASEGASLFYPENDADAKIVLEYWQATVPQINEIFVGVSSLLAKRLFETIDGRPVEDVYNIWAEDEPNNSNNNEHCVAWRGTNYNDVACFKNLPFICRKTFVSLEWNQMCNMPYMDYKLNEQLGRCYKFHSKPMNWPDAHALCSSEQSYLAIINSKEEVEYLAKLTDTAPKNKIRGNEMPGVVLLGFHDTLNEGWTTVRGAPLEDSGYTTWGDDQSDGTPRVKDEKCGSMLYNGTLNSVLCDERGFFICEHDVITNFTGKTGDKKC